MSSSAAKSPSSEPQVSRVEWAFWFVIRVIVCILCVVGFIWYVLPHGELTDAKLSGETMGTRYNLVLAGIPKTTDTVTLQAEIQAQLDAVDRMMSTYKPDSEVSRFSASTSTDWFEVSQETADVVAQALEVSKLTDGAFDVTVAPFVRLWGFGAGATERSVPPSDEEIAAVQPTVGWRHLEVRTNPPALKKSFPALQLDLSGIAKGYAVDEIARLLESRDLKNYMVEIGGEVRVHGLKQNGSPWVIGIDMPRPDVPFGDYRPFTKVDMSDGAMATSGDYRNFHEIGTLRVSHLIDPRRGVPCERLVEGESEPVERLASVSIRDVSCARADALATAFFVLGEQQAMELAAREKIPALLLFRPKAEGAPIRTVKTADWNQEGKK